MLTLSELKARKGELLSECRSILDRAAAENRDLTAAESAEYEARHADLVSVNARIEKQSGDEESRRQTTENLERLLGRPSEGRGFLNLRNLAESVRQSVPEYSARAFLAAGSTATPASIITDTPVSLGKPATSLFDVLPVRTIEGAEYGYLRQTARTNNAAPVAVGGTKPTSVMTLTRISGTLNVVAHLSEAIHELWIADSQSLRAFVEGELGTGISTALEDQALNGTGVAPELNGIAATATGTQAYATSPAVTIRTAISQLEAAGQRASAIVMAAADWLALETEVSALSGHYVLGTQAGVPLDAAARRLWGVPVVISTAATTGTAHVLAEESVGLVTDGDIRLQWGRVDDDFALNQVRARAEIRAEVEVYKPASIIACTLTAA